MNVEIGTEAALFPENEYLNGIFVAVQWVWEEWRKFKKGIADEPSLFMATWVLE